MMLEKESPVSFVYPYVNHDSDTSDDFGALERQLHDQRPVATDAELERIERRAVTAASARRSDTSRGRFLSPARLAMVSLVSGAILVGGSGASLAVSGLSSDNSAGIAQYLQSPPPRGTTPNTDTGAVAPSQDQGGGDDGCNTSSARAAQNTCPEAEEESGILPSLNNGDVTTTPAADAQETKQVASGGSDGRLPFTGLVALPLLLVGVALLSGGFLLRSRASAERAA